MAILLFWISYAFYKFIYTWIVNTMNQNSDNLASYRIAFFSPTMLHALILGSLHISAIFNIWLHQDRLCFLQVYTLILPHNRYYHSYWTSINALLHFVTVDATRLTKRAGQHAFKLSRLVMVNHCWLFYNCKKPKECFEVKVEGILWERPVKVVEQIENSWC